eukprot:CFRG3319T1
MASQTLSEVPVVGESVPTDTMVSPGPALQKTFRHMYRNSNCLAPMVRAGTLPLRLLCLRQGAHLVYSEELIDHSLLKCTRSVNPHFNTIEYLNGDGSVVFSTCSEEKNAVILQLGTSSADRAVKVAKTMETDVAGVDVNMGCPKPYSVLGGMGAALLSNPENIKSILTSLVATCSVPVTCKVRILDTVEQTVELVKMIEATGVAAIGIHGRTIPQRPRENANYDHIRAVRALINPNFPIIANGGSLDYIDNTPGLSKFREASGCDSVMMARAAQWNPALFSEGQTDVVCKRELSEQYLEIAISHGQVFENAKWNILSLLHFDKDHERTKKVAQSATYKEMCEHLTCLPMFEALPQSKIEKIGMKRRLPFDPEQIDMIKAKKLKEGVVCSSDCYIRKEWSKKSPPKQIMAEYLRKLKMKPPAYEIVTEENKRGFQAILTIGEPLGTKYTSLHWSANKKDAEHSACIVAFEALNIPHERVKLTHADSPNPLLDCTPTSELEPTSHPKKLHHSQLTAPLEHKSTTQDVHNHMSVSCAYE